MDANWKDIAKKAGIVAAVIAILVWLFTPTDPRFNRK